MSEESEEIDYFNFHKHKIGKLTTLIPVEELEALRADLQRVTDECDLRGRTIARVAFERDALKEAARRVLKEINDSMGDFSALCASVQELTALAAVKPDVCEACGGSGIDSVVEYRDGTQEKLACSVCNGTGQAPIEQKEV